MTAPEDVAEDGDACLDGWLAGVAEAEYQLRRAGGTVGAMGTHPVQPDQACPGRMDHLVFRCSRGEVRHGVEACRQAGQPHAGGVGSERADEDVAAGGIFGAHPPQVNRLHRIVISSQPVDLPWDNAELVVARDDNDLIAAVTEFKRQPGSPLGVPGGVRTAQRFVRLGLNNEYVLHVHPVAIGAGQPLFTQKTELQLISAKTYSSGITRLHYQTHADS